MSVQAYGAGSPLSALQPSPGSSRSDVQLIGSERSAQSADQAEVRNRCAGNVHESLGANIRSCRTKWSAYAQ